MLKVGADVEGFVFDKKTGKIDSAIPYIKGTKHCPQETKHGAIQYDNVLAEFNVIPADSAAQFTVNTRDIIGDLKEELETHGKTFRPVSSYNMPEALLDNPEAQQFGCEPDMNIWALEVEHKVNALEIGTLRTAGGHVHLGWDHLEEVTPRKQMEVIKALDFTLGLPSVLYDDDTVRRRFYGQAGHFRAKPYGVEYRVLSNFWIKKVGYMKWVYKAAFAAFARGSDILARASEADVKLMTRAINTSNKEVAKDLCDKLHIDYLKE